MSKINKAIAALSVVASLGVSAAPMATFAATSTPNAQKDILNVTIEEVCAFGYGDITPGYHTDGTTTGYTGTSTTAREESGSGQDRVAAAGAGNGIWDLTAPKLVTGYDGTVQSPVADTDTAYGIMEANTVNKDFAKTTLNVVCNDNDGYTITASTTNLAPGSGVTGNIASTAAEPAAGTSSWAFQIADTSTNTTNHGVIQTAAGTTSDSGYWYGGYTTNATTIISSAAATDKTTPDTGDIWTMTYGVGISKAQPAATYEGHVIYQLASIDPQQP